MPWKWIRISLKSWMGYPDGSGTKTKSYEPVSQIACISISIFSTKRTYYRVPGLKGEALFSNLLFFWCVCRSQISTNLYTNLYYLFIGEFSILKITTTTHNDIVCISFNSKSAHSNPPIFLHKQKRGQSQLSNGIRVWGLQTESF